MSNSPYTVEQIIGEPRDWQTKAGKPMKSYLLKVSGEDRNVELSQFPDTDAPTVGQVIDGALEESANGNFPPKLRKARQGGGGFGGPRPEDPERAKRIVRQHSQEMAIRFAAASGALVEIDLRDRETVGAIVNEQLRPLIDWFEKDATR